jgi:hypothetical protein
MLNCGHHPIVESTCVIRIDYHVSQAPNAFEPEHSKGEEEPNSATRNDSPTQKAIEIVVIVVTVVGATITSANANSS